MSIYRYVSKYDVKLITRRYHILGGGHVDVKGNVLHVLNYIQRHNELCAFLTSELHAGEWSASRTVPCTSVEEASGTL
jgi:hypothetical protein